MGMAVPRGDWQGDQCCVSAVVTVGVAAPGRLENALKAVSNLLKRLNRRC
jgi:hypothetical protein